ncbi:hypothetical protein AD930_13225 [Acetobacter malorum]|nr:hypothetical protein AD930_13225 [Acetobacter malorum]
MVDFDPRINTHKVVPLDEYFEISAIKNVMASFGVNIIDNPTGNEEDTTDGWHCFCKGAKKYGEIGQLGRSALGEMGAQIIRTFTPKKFILEFSNILCQSLYGTLGIKHALQMRIENDWVGFSSSSESYKNIIQKTINTFPDIQSIYILCDEKNTDKKEDVRNYFKNDFGVDAFFKSDFFDISKKNNLFLSLVDFEIASNARYFIGNCESTFSSFVSFEKFCKTYEPVLNHYIYNTSKETLQIRQDSGGSTIPAVAQDKIHRRKKLFSIEDFEKERIWKIELKAHISNHGDFISRSLITDASPCGNLVCGSMDEQMRSIEAFSITSHSPDINLEYRAKLKDGTITEWKSNGDFSGTIGNSLAIQAFAIRITGPASLTCDCIYGGLFQGDHFPIRASNGQWSEAPQGGNLIAMQITFLEK